MLLIRMLAWLKYLIDCTFMRKAMRKQRRMEKCLTDRPTSVWSPKTMPTCRKAVRPPPLLAMRTAMRELSMMPAVASIVNAIMLFLNVCTANTPFFPESYMMIIIYGIPIKILYIY